MLKSRNGNVIGSAAPEAQANRVLSFGEVIEILGISKPTFFRSVKPQLPIVYISERRQGVRTSDFEAWLQKKTQEAA